MDDIVNTFFRAHFPADAAENWEMEYCGSGLYGRRYKGEKTHIFPAIECADGATFSVQGHFGAYSSPREDFADEGYRTVEVLCDEEPLFADYSGGEVGERHLYGYVPTVLVCQVIALHGGLVPQQDTSQ
jgi:hypothetical protein